MNPTNQLSFWTMIYPVVTLLIGISSTLLILFLKERLKRNTKIKLERIKLYDKKRFNAYNSLYGFINKSFSLFPLERPREDFVYLIKDHYLLKVRQHLPYFRKDIRGKLKTIESHYDCLGNQDLYPKIPLEQFLKSDFLEILNSLNSDVEKIFDKWE